jgi:hypothetical protein
MPRGRPSKLNPGVYGSKLYKTWSRIKRRCYNPNHDTFKYYGGRGITLCDDWVNSPQTFIDWAENSGYKEGLTIDRIDNSKEYSPSNCRWVSMSVQNHNTRQTKLDDEKVRFIRIALQNKTHTGKELAKMFNVSPTLISAVKHRLVWFELEEAHGKSNEGNCTSED